MLITKRAEVTKQGFCKILLLVLIQFYFNLIVSQVGGVEVGAHLSLIGRRRGWGGRLFEAGCLLTFSAFRIGANSRWVLIRGWPGRLFK